MAKKTVKKSVARSPRKNSAKKGRAKKYLYFFGNGKADGDRSMKDLLGGKGSGLAEMTAAGLPVPDLFAVVREEHRAAVRPCAWSVA